MAKIIDVSALKPSAVCSDGLKGRALDCEKLFVEDLDALVQLNDYCLNRRNKVDQRAARVLIEKGLLEKNGELPDLTNEAMYYLRTGSRPFWKKNQPPR